MDLLLGMILGILLCSQWHTLERVSFEADERDLREKVNKTRKLSQRKMRV